MSQAEQNLKVETSKNHLIQLPKRFEKHYDFIDVTQDGLFLLGTSNLTGRIWSSSLWLFNDFSHPPNIEKCLAGMEFDSSISTGKWFDNGFKIIVGTDSGAIHILSLKTIIDNKKQYLLSDGVACEHDDIVTSIDISSNSKKILSGSIDMNIKVWDAESFSCNKTYNSAHAQMVTSVCWQPGKGDTFVSTSTDGNSLIWDTHLDKPASLLMRNESGYTSSCWINDNCLALGSNSGSLSLLDLRMKSEIDRNFCSKRAIHKISLNKNKEFLAVCADEPTVRVFSCSQYLLNHIYACQRHTDFVRGLSWESPYHLYSCAWDSKILFHKIPVDISSAINIVDINGTMKFK